MLDTNINISRKRITDAQANLISKEDLEGHDGLERLSFTGMSLSSAFRALAKMCHSKELSASLEGVSKALDILAAQSRIECQNYLILEKGSM